ncbi:MAG: hypothetical protein B9S32_08840 [Verrucomicrobia bacterium Tous-C9LFEB]|nr:MAG: hypothetical protein B9S32_08840 [Verrucomicrobia bacterium Tous-C9LFEB]
MNILLLSQNLELQRCPHCGIARPLLSKVGEFNTQQQNGFPIQVWRVYLCSNCSMLVSAYAKRAELEVINYFPKSTSIDVNIPQRPRDYLMQANESLHTPAASIMVAASAVDAMLKVKGYKDGSLYERIEKAATEHLITKEMAKWAHQVRLQANDQRHADEAEAMPNVEDAKRVFDFAMALGAFLFSLPAMIEKGLKESKE